MITYRPADAARPVLCELNELELFSCVLGLEEETALAIVEPAALHAALRSDAVLHVSGSCCGLVSVLVWPLQALPVKTAFLAANFCCQKSAEVVFWSAFLFIAAFVFSIPLYYIFLSVLILYFYFFINC